MPTSTVGVLSTVHTIYLSINRGKYQHSSTGCVIYCHVSALHLSVATAAVLLSTWCAGTVYSSCMGFQLSMHSIPMHAPDYCALLSMYTTTCPGPVCDGEYQHYACLLSVWNLNSSCVTTFSHMYVCDAWFHCNLRSHTLLALCRSYCMHACAKLAQAHPQCIPFA